MKYKCAQILKLSEKDFSKHQHSLKGTERDCHMMQVTLMALKELAWLAQVGKASGGVGHVPMSALEVER